jgi:hypothetical protein
MTTTATAPGTYNGKTADEYRELARKFYAARQESWERSDTDGFVSQWASGLTAQQYSLSAQLADADGATEACALFDLEGNLVPSVHGWGEYGEYFIVLDNDERGCRRFFNPSKARNEATARKNNAAKGFYVGTATVPAKVEIVGGGTGLSGAASCYVAIIPARKEVSADTVISITDNGR